MVARTETDQAPRPTASPIADRILLIDSPFQTQAGTRIGGEIRICLECSKTGRPAVEEQISGLPPICLPVPGKNRFPDTGRYWTDSDLCICDRWLDYRCLALELSTADSLQKMRE